MLLLSGIACLTAPSAPAEAAKIKVLILSGANNHNWRETTPAIKASLEETGRFTVDVEEKVPDLKPDSFAPYAVILSDFNTFGPDAPAKTWDEATKKGLIDHLAKGHGLVIVHAGSSVFYDWPEFQKLACGTWEGKTSHGQIHINQVTFTDEESPITKGLQPFWIRDEFWQDVKVAPGAKALASVTPDKAFQGSGKPENILFTTEVGKARGFAIFLGHDAITMKNSAWRCLLQRGTEWAATGKVTIAPPKDWPTAREDAEPPAFSWQRNDAGLELRNGDKTVWRLVFDGKQPKSFFHPLATLRGDVLTAFEPADHPWHRGLWWSWKTINGLNYWEEDPATRTSAGTTQLTDAKITNNPDFTAHVELSFSYHPPGKPAVMTELRQLSISRPDMLGTYTIDWTSTFTAGNEPVKLDRTPPAHLGGPAHGGYAGLSLRLPPGTQGWRFLTSEGGADGHGKPARWVDLSGPNAGIAIMDHPSNPRHPSPWYLSGDPNMLYFGPAALFNEPLEIAPRQALELSYRIVVHSKPMRQEQLQDEWRAFSSRANP